MKMKPHTVLMSRGLWGMGSWPTQAAVKANDRWWEALLAATCYLGVERFQQSEIKSKPLVADFFLLLFWFVLVFSFHRHCTKQFHLSSLNWDNKKQVVGEGGGGVVVDAEVDPDSYGGVV